jgi:hypothetical protein
VNGIWIEIKRSIYNGCPAQIRKVNDPAISDATFRIWVFYRVSLDRSDFMSADIKIAEANLIQFVPTTESEVRDQLGSLLC